MDSNEEAVTINSEPCKIAIIGLGYVGLPLAVEFAKKYKVLGFDIDEARITELRSGIDRTKEASIDNLRNVTTLANREVGLSFSSDAADLNLCNIFIITVPTPIDNFKSPDLKSLISASVLVGKALKKSDIVIYESTVYPGCTEEDCVPELEKSSGLIFNRDFFVGYSPERISPGDKVHTLTKIVKVTSGSTENTARFVDELYASIISAGTYKVASIKIAEAAKAIENAQRDINISFMNELSLIFDKMGIDTNDVINAAGTKWNFVKFRPGLVGGHCISVDPYYLTYKAQMLGYQPQVILSGRRVNDYIGPFIANKVVKLMIAKDQKIKKSKALILGFTFKENCPDVRNTRVIDIYNELLQFGIDVDVYDPFADVTTVRNDYRINVANQLDTTKEYNAIILAVAHDEFLNLDYKKIGAKNAVIFDTKACLDRELVDSRL